MKRSLFLALWIGLLPITAWAHPGHGESGFVNGVMHPFSGLDHVLGMLAVGVWASRNSGYRRWFAPAAFLGGMLAGGVMGLDGIVPVFIESAVAASAVVAALLVVLAIRMPLLAQSGIALCFAIWHGIAHGAELPAMSSPINYACGFVIATALLLVSGVFLGKLLQRDHRDRWLGAGMLALAVPLFWL